MRACGSRSLQARRSQKGWVRSPPALAPCLAALLPCCGAPNGKCPWCSRCFYSGWLLRERWSATVAGCGPDHWRALLLSGAGNQGPSLCPVGTQGCGSTRHPQPSPSLPWAGPWWGSPRLLSALCMTLFCSCYQERARRFGSQGLHSCAGPRLQGSPSPGPVGTAVPLQRPGASSANCPIPALERREPWLPCCALAQVSSAAEPPGPL